jgi:signal transduction histidine kinase
MIEEGVLKRVAIAHVDPEKEQLVEELERRYPEAQASTPAANVIRTGAPEFVPELTDELLSARTVDEGHRELVREFGLRSYMALPLIARGTTLGAITFGSASRAHDAQDVALAKDIATRGAIAIENAQLHATVVQANRVKSDFLSVMSHELRTPLSAITGYAGLLEEGIPDPATPAQKEHLERIRLRAVDLLRLIEEILAFSRMGNGDERFHFEDVGLHDLIAEVSGTGEALAKERGLAFDVRGPKGDAQIRTDANKVRQILVELISNAIKFTREGKVELRTVMNDGTAGFQVSDTGIGVPAELHERIFEPFFQAEDALTREVGGIGIGLAVARRLARRLGGDVTVDSTPGEGSTFTLTIPVRPADEAEPAPAEEASPKRAVG